MHCADCQHKWRETKVNVTKMLQSPDLRSVQVVWSTGAKSLILWDAFTGVYLGSVSRMSDYELDRRSYTEHSERDERFVPRLHIDHRRVST